MFPIPWNKAYRKKDGSLTIIDDMFVDAPELQEEIDALDDKIGAIDGRLESAESAIETLEDEKIVFENSSGTASTTNVVQDVTGYKYADIYLRCVPSTSVEENMYCVTIPIQIDTPFNIVLAGKTSIMYMFMYKFKFATSTSFTVESSYRVALTDGTIYDSTNQVALHKIVVHN